MENVNNAKQSVSEELAKFQMSDGRWCMYVKPYTLKLQEELENYRKCKSAVKRVSITEKDGTYCITSNDIIKDFEELRTSFWFMAFWKFRSEARNTFATEIVGGRCRKLRWENNNMNMEFTEENKDNYFYVVALSPYFIEATSLPRFQIPQCA